MSRDALLKDFMDRLEKTAPGETEFHQAVRHVVRDTITIEKAHGDYTAAKVLERLTVPDRIIGFRVVWQDDAGQVQVNRGWRVQFSNAIGPYKGGLRFHPTVSPSMLKFLGFEQVFKNALTGLPLGGGKGGSDFDPKGRSDAEIMRFCQAFMRQLAPHIGPDRDIPAGDINVGTREIGWLFAAYKAHALEFTGALTGKGPSFGGSAIRTQATGYGLVYFVEAMLGDLNDDLTGKRVAISGKGNVATHAAEKALARGAKVISLSDTSGTLWARDGLDQDTIAWVRSQKAAGGDIADPPSKALRFVEGKTPWSLEPDIALPCATQNELSAAMVQELVDGGARIVAEGANMPLTADAQDKIMAAAILHAPGKAANAGGVAVSGLEMSQNSHRQFAPAEDVDRKLKDIMRAIHARVADNGREGNRIDYVRGANIAGFRKVADAVTAMGAI
ncbi:NADP-specific glutamate dehydrogenase [Aestuariivita sp.]|jgi:glutamate dehydrogenase (NADP+)|uniref:NADP-specific glutamate dehydrogenase n=1 Tax=Aestuariivita sp. TaxID=1872407 RepID=UPI00216EFC69|nr:NADP-specific glutamate dehydrogenase [Aestuariivita sp.]MCE8008595.1 NADP-specific glutamate dehydrogenase [Aestuariivita sp.]